MKLIDIMKRYNKCILKENAKLRSIYNALIRESGAEGEETADECDACGDPSCKDGKKCGAKPANTDECDDADTMTLEEFLGEKEAEDGVGEEGGKSAEKKPADDGDDEEGGKPKGKPADDDDDESQDECELEEGEELVELQKADDFFNGKSSEDKPAAKKPAKKTTDEEEEGGETNESAFSPSDFYQNVSEQYKRKPEAALGESLRRHYKKANRRLFNF